MVFRRDKGVMGQDFLKNPAAPPWGPVLPWGALQSLGRKLQSVVSTEFGSP